MKKLKYFICVSLVALTLGVSQPAHAWTMCTMPWICFWMSPLESLASALEHLASEKLNHIIYDIEPGLKKIEDNIGMHQDEGICGVSVTGTTGCDLATEEEGAEQEKELEAQEAVIPDSRIDLINNPESADMFNDLRKDVKKQVLTQNDASANKGCSCSDSDKAAAKNGEECVPSNFDPTECAVERQNEAFIVAATGAASVADTDMANLEKQYKDLDEYVGKVNSNKTIAAYVGGLGLLSVYGSAVTVEIMHLYAADLRMQSYRNILASGVSEVTLPSSK